MARQELNTELNLTSMIDLMSTLVAFLLVTAVWLHIAAIPASVDSKGRTPASSKPKNTELVVRLSKKGINLKWPPLKGKRPTRFIKKSKKGYPLESLTAVIQKALKKNSALTSSVTGDNRVPYGAVAEAIDAVKAGGIVSVSLSTH